MSPSAYLRGSGHAIFFTSQYLAHLERLGVRVINGYKAWQTEYRACLTPKLDELDRKLELKQIDIETYGALKESLLARACL